VLTNGTVIPDQKTLDRLANPKVILKISEYKNPRQKIRELAGICEKNKITAQVVDTLEWQDCAGLSRHKRQKEENEALLRTCVVRSCPSVVDGKLFFCPFAGNLYTLRAAPESYHEYVRLTDENIPADETRRQINGLMRLKHLKACDFCGGRPVHGNSIPPAVQTEKPLGYRSYVF
jgi:hypothetical protein